MLGSPTIRIQLLLHELFARFKSNLIDKRLKMEMEKMDEVITMFPQMFITIIKNLIVDILLYLVYKYSNQRK